jgi:hypothetical protein
MFLLDDEVSWAGNIGYVDIYVDDVFPVDL